MKRGELRIKNETLAELDAYLLTRGIPLPPGQVREAEGVSIRNAQGEVLPSAGQVLQRRTDGSIEWLRMDILLALKGQESTSLGIELKTAAQPTVANPVTVNETPTGVTLANGLTSVEIGREGGSLIKRMVIQGRTVVDERHIVDLVTVDGGGKIHRASLAGPWQVTVSHANRLTATVQIEGTHRARDGRTFMDFALRITLGANSPDIKFEHTFYCREAREGKIAIREMKLVLPTTLDPAAIKLLRQSHHGHDWFNRAVEIPENVEVVASSVGDIDNYAQNQKGPGVSHPCAGGSVFIRNMESLHENWGDYPFHMRPGQGSGFRADLNISGMRGVAPVLGWREPDFTLVTTFEHFRQLHPKSIAIDENILTYSIWPAWSTPMQVVQGVSKSHIFWLTGLNGAASMDDVETVLHRWEYGYVEPLDVSFDPAWPAFCEVLDCQYFLKYQPEKYPLLENLIEVCPAAGNPARHTYDRQAAQGMFHFADLVSADAASCTNNEDDAQVLFPLEYFLRTGHTYAWDYGKETARHYMEVDFCEWSTDPRQKGGLIPHAGQHFVGNVYPSHQWSEGILAYYYLTGDERARKVVIAVGDNNIYWAFNKIDCVACDGREAGVPLINLAAAYRLTRDTKYLDAARHICENFFVRWISIYGEFKYPYPQGTASHPHKLISGYGDWSSFSGLYKLWELTQDDYYKDLAIQLLRQAIKPGSFGVNDTRSMDFYAAWTLGRLTGDMDEVVKIVSQAIPMLLRRGGHPLRRNHFLQVLDERGLIDDRQVGTRAGSV